MIVNSIGECTVNYASYTKNVIWYSLSRGCLFLI